MYSTIAAQNCSARLTRQERGKDTTRLLESLDEARGTASTAEGKEQMKISQNTTSRQASFVSMRMSYGRQEPKKYVDHLRQRLAGFIAAQEGLRQANTAISDEPTNKSEAL